MFVWLLVSSVAAAKKPPAPPPPEVEAVAPRMSNDGLHAFVSRVLGEEPAAEARVAPNQWRFELEGHAVAIITDARADRMRMMVPIGPADQLPPELSTRMLQANFDAVLDARYAIAQGLVWSVFIHPLSPLDDAQLASGLAQTVTAAATFGTAFTSGALVFGGGDTTQMQRELYERIIERGRRQGI